MSRIEYLNEEQFRVHDAEQVSDLYFPLANEAGMMSAVTPDLSGDSKTGQNTFLLEPVSVEDLHNSKSSRNFWIYEEGRGAWSATGCSALQKANVFTKEETVTVEAGYMWHKVTRESPRFQLESTITSFVPSNNDQAEIMMVTIKNLDQQQRTLVPTVAIPIYARSAEHIRDHRHVTSLLNRIMVSPYGVVVDPTLTFDERGHQKNEVVYGVMAFERKNEDVIWPVGCFPTLESYIGEGGNLEVPRTVLCNSQAFQTEGHVEGYEAMGALRFQEVVLDSQEEVTFFITMSIGESKEALEQRIMEYSQEGKVAKLLEDTKEYWKKKVTTQYQTADPDFDFWMRWVCFQPLLRRIFGCSFLPHHDYGHGGRGWRDLWQDSLSLLMLEPEHVRELLVSYFGGVRVDGSNATIIGAKPGEFIADRNKIARVWMDHGVWPFIATEAYINETGDLSILLDCNTYFKDTQVLRGEGQDYEWNPEDGNIQKDDSGVVYRGTIFEHLLVQHITAFYDVGKHNHIRLRGADWNDALDMAKENGESVAFTALYADNIEKLGLLAEKLHQSGVEKAEFFEEFLDLLTELQDDRIKVLFSDSEKKRTLLNAYMQRCRHELTGKKVAIDLLELSKQLQKAASFMKAYISTMETVSDDQGHTWLNSYYDNSGEQVEGLKHGQVRMMLTGQVFTIMSGTSSVEQVKEQIKAVDQYLYRQEQGGYCLNTDFKEIKMDLGRMFGFAYGTKENGAVFSHMAVMYANALYRRGFAKEGYRVIDSLYRHCSDFDKSKIYPGVPEYIGPNGKGVYHYLTGAASWLMITVTKEMFGVHGVLGELEFTPKLLANQFNEIGEASIALTFLGRELTICYQNKEKLEYGEYQVNEILIDGKRYDRTEVRNRIEKSQIMLLNQEEKHSITVVLGR